MRRGCVSSSGISRILQMRDFRFTIVKLLAHRAGLPGNEISLLIVLLAPAHRAGLAGHLPVKEEG